MFRKKRKDQLQASGAGRHRRPSQQRAVTQTYSYYANRQPSTSVPSTTTNRSRGSTELPEQRWYARRAVRRWAIVALGVVVLVELTFLSVNGRVTIIDAAGNLNSDADVVVYEKTFDNLLASNVLNRNKLTIDTNGIATRMRAAHPELQSVTVTTPLLGIHPSIYINVSEAMFTLKQDSSSYVLSAAGYVTGRGLVASLPVVADETGEDVRVAKQLLPSSHVTFMHTIWYQLTKQGIAVDRLVLPKGKAFEVDVRLKNKPYYLKFNVTEDALRQSGAAVAVIDQLGSAEPKEYIDLRVPGKAYYK